MEQRQRIAQPLYLCFILFMLGCSVGTVNGVDLAKKCGQVVQKVLPCLSFATGKAAAPSKECCDAGAKIKDDDPECLCYIIQQTHKGSQESKSLGIQEAKLLQLPAACNLKNASITNCPKLLGLSPSSADAAIFTNASSTVSSPASTAGTTTSQSQNDSYGTMLRPTLVAPPMVVASAILLIVIPSGFFSVYS